MNYVKMYDDVAPRAWCEAQIDLFEDDIKQQQEQDCGNGKTLTQINMLHSKDTRWRTNANELVNYIMTTVEQYKKDVGIESFQWPITMGFEPPKVKRYMPGVNESFPAHVDVLDKSTMNRFLVCFLYLNTVEVGGETEVSGTPELFSSEKFAAKQGSMLLFPPMWTHPHIGHSPVSGPKYIIGGYLTYA